MSVDKQLFPTLLAMCELIYCPQTLMENLHPHPCVLATLSHAAHSRQPSVYSLHPLLVLCLGVAAICQANSDSPLIFRVFPPSGGSPSPSHGCHPVLPRLLSLPFADRHQAAATSPSLAFHHQCLGRGSNSCSLGLGVGRSWTIGTERTDSSIDPRNPKSVSPGLQ